MTRSFDRGLQQLVPPGGGTAVHTLQLPAAMNGQQVVQKIGPLRFLKRLLALMVQHDVKAVFVRVQAMVGALEGDGVSVAME